MVFILLIFFIVTTVFVDESGLAANTPEPSSNPPEDPDQERVSFLIRSTGQVMYQGNEIALAGIRGIVTPAMQQEQYPITVSIEPGVPMHRVVAVIDEAESGGAPQVTMKAVSE